MKKRIIGFNTHLNANSHPSSSAKRLHARESSISPSEAPHTMTHSASLTRRREIVRHLLDMSLSPPQFPSIREDPTILATDDPSVAGSSVQSQADVPEVQNQPMVIHEQIQKTASNIVYEQPRMYPVLEEFQIVDADDYNDTSVSCRWTICLDRLFCL